MVNDVLENKIQNLDKKLLKPACAFEYIIESCKIEKDVISMIHNATTSDTLHDPVNISAEIDANHNIYFQMYDIPTEQQQEFKKLRSIFISEKAQKPVDYEDTFASLKTIIDELAKEIDPNYDRSLLAYVDLYHQLP